MRASERASERNCNGDFASVGLGNRCTLIFELWSHTRPTAEGRVSTYTLGISGMVTIRYFIYDKVLRDAFLLFETRFFCCYRTQCLSTADLILYYSCMGRELLIQLNWWRYFWGIVIGGWNNCRIISN